MPGLNLGWNCIEIEGQSDVGDFLILTILRCWWQNEDVGDVQIGYVL